VGHPQMDGPGVHPFTGPLLWGAVNSGVAPATLPPIPRDPLARNPQPRLFVERAYRPLCVLASFLGLLPEPCDVLVGHPFGIIHAAVYFNAHLGGCRLGEESHS
jgi:hypothetical protein